MSQTCYFFCTNRQLCIALNVKNLCIAMHSFYFWMRCWASCPVVGLRKLHGDEEHSPSDVDWTVERLLPPSEVNNNNFRGARSQCWGLHLFHRAFMGKVPQKLELCWRISRFHPSSPGDRWPGGGAHAPYAWVNQYFAHLSFISLAFQVLFTLMNALFLFNPCTKLIISFVNSKWVID
jgi:hypothetical protein